jgi:hypothetical protein
VGAYFAEGGATLYVSRITGPAAVTATGAALPFTATAASPGAWGNTLKVRYEEPAAATG